MQCNCRRFTWPYCNYPYSDSPGVIHPGRVSYLHFTGSDLYRLGRKQICFAFSLFLFSFTVPLIYLKPCDPQLHSFWFFTPTSHSLGVEPADPCIPGVHFWMWLLVKSWLPCLRSAASLWVSGGTLCCTPLSGTGDSFTRRASCALCHS